MPIQSDHQLDTLLATVSDPDCRTIIRATTSQELTAAEVAETADLPLSTVYRKLDRLIDASLLVETRRVTSNGHHPSQYRCHVDHIHIKVPDTTADAFSIELSHNPQKNHFMALSTEPTPD